MRTRVKICGLTREADIAQAVQAGADAIGFVCYAGSKRHVDLKRAAQLRREVPAFVSVVTLFVNPSDDDVRAVLDEVGPDLLQFHGDESPKTARATATASCAPFASAAPASTPPTPSRPPAGPTAMPPAGCSTATAPALAAAA